MIESLFRKAPLLLLPLFLPCIIYGAKIDDTDGKGFILELFGNNINSAPNGNFYSDILGSNNATPISNPYESGVYAYIRSFVDRTTNDFGFNYENVQAKTTPSLFLITRYQDNNDKYIESLEIDWSGIGDNGGRLHIYSRENTPFIDNENISSIMESSYDEGIISPFDPDLQKEKTSVHKFSHNVKYIAFVYEEPAIENLGLKNLARFSAFRVHFVDEPPVSNPEPEKPHIDIPWLNTGITISNYYNELTEMLGLDSLSSEVVEYDDLDSNPTSILETLTYSLRPEFPTTPKPTSPDDLEDWKWWLFNEFESKNQPYDGYLTEDDLVDGVIMCNYDSDNACLVIPAPCSGLYTLTVSNGEEQIFEATLNIWPNIYNSYEVDTEGIHEYDKDQRFNINTVKFPEIICPENQDRISLPYPYAEDKESAFMAENVSICIPGLYNETIYFRKVNNTQTQSTRDADSDGWVKYDGSNLDFQDLTDSNKIYLQLRIDKNEASTPLTDDNNSLHSFEVYLSTDASIPTGVESVVDESEKAPVELFTLSGMRVVSSSPSSGLYIRRQGSRAGIILIP